MNPLALAQLLSLLIPLGMKVYAEIQQANSGTIPPMADVLAAADKNWDTIYAAGLAELAKAKPQPPPPIPPA